MKRPYTRKSKVRTKSYVKTVPPSKIIKFSMGDSAGYQQGKYSHQVMIVVNEPIQIRDNALESARQLAHREIELKLKGNYFFSINAYPHHILRENKMLTGAGADRMQTGMQLSFGKSIGIAARFSAGSSIFSVACNKEFVSAVRSILHNSSSKLPGKTSIIVKEIKKREK